MLSKFYQTAIIKKVNHFSCHICQYYKTHIYLKNKQLVLNVKSDSKIELKMFLHIH